MKLQIQSPRGTLRVDWGHFALLRDNIQHYLEAREGVRFESIHAIERAVDSGTESLDACELRNEVVKAWRELAGLELDASAVSLRTRAILTGCDRAPQVRGTIVARRARWELPVKTSNERTVQDVLASFVEAVLTLTEHAQAGERLLVVREPARASDRESRGPE